ncbi:MAG: GxxExxY protein [Bacteroidales bacterium]|nr:GxxExxY protein [Bacteroidales bacterium]
MKVHRRLGPGFLEAVYQEALTKEFNDCNIPFKSQHKLQLSYNGQPLKKYYVADFICYEKIILELKTVNYLNKLMTNILYNHLKAIDYKLGILINFSKPSLEYKRVLNLHT